MNQRVFCRNVWTRAGLARFERDVNACLKEGWVVRDMEVIPRWACYLCVAFLEAEPEPDAYTPSLES